MTGPIPGGRPEIRPENKTSRVPGGRGTGRFMRVRAGGSGPGGCGAALLPARRRAAAGGTGRGGVAVGRALRGGQAGASGDEGEGEQGGLDGSAGHGSPESRSGSRR